MINSLLAIAIALILGLLSTRLMKIIGLPNVTGYLLVGLLIGPYALGLIPGEDSLIQGAPLYISLDGKNVYMMDLFDIISTVALGFIGFSIGVEFKFSHIKEIGKSAITITFFQALTATLCVDLVLVATSFFTNMPVYEAIILGAIATATAPAATLMVVRQYKAKGIVTGTLLPVVALDDAVGLIVFAISNSIALSLASGSQVTVLNVLVYPLVEIICSFIVGFAIGMLLCVVPRFFKSKDNRVIATVACVFLSLGVCQLFSWLEDNNYLPFALSDLLVCMMAGATFVNVRREAGEMMENTDHWTPVVLMLFFVLSGAELNLRMFNSWQVIVCLILYVVARCAGKYFGAALGATVTHADKNVRKYLGITLFPQAGVAIGMATMCKSEFVKAGYQEVGSKIVTITMCAVLIYELVGPVLTKVALTKAGEISPEMLRKKKPSAVIAGAIDIPVSDGSEHVENQGENK